MNHYKSSSIIIGLILLASHGASADTDTKNQLPKGPGQAENLKLKAPITRWDDALPLGNGLMGGLLWGEGTKLKLSLDRGDLWDERTHGEKEWWKKYTYAKGKEMIETGKTSQVNAWWDGPYNGVTPTKLPAGRLEIQLAADTELDLFELSLSTAEGHVHMADQTKVSAFFSADVHIAMLRIPKGLLKSFDLIPSGAGASGTTGPSSGGAVKKLGYPAAKHGREGNAQWYVQDAADGFQYCVFVQSKQVGDHSLLAVAVTSTNDGARPLELAERRCAKALEQGYAKMKEPHLAWWKTFWSQSAISLPKVDQPILNQYYMVQYFHGAASRRGAPPMPLQGVWTADNGGLPPWKGDYHNDLNTQMTYIAYQSAGHFEEGLSYLDFLWDRKKVFEDFARDFYETKGLACPGVMSLAGQPLGGWGQYSMSPTMSAWSAHLFYLHWRYTMDDAFLAERAYPWAAGVGQCMLGLLKPNADGVLVLPLSSSPEMFNNSARAWLVPNSNYDLMCLKMLFLSLQEMAETLGKDGASVQWAKAAKGLGDFHTDENGVLMLNANEPFPESHRHLSNLMALHPFNLITSDGGEEDQKIIEASVEDWDTKGTQAWTGYSFSWYSCLRARVGHAEAALRYLDIYTSAFVTRNGFHVNGDQAKSGYSRFTYRPFTLEGNFLAAQAVQEMLLQSWSATPGVKDSETIRVFPAMPWRWHEASFRDLRVEGGHRVSAIRKNNATTWLRVTAGRDAVVRIRDNFSGRTPTWSVEGVKKEGQNFVIQMTRGQQLEARLPLVKVIPPTPDDLAEKVKIADPMNIRASKLPVRIGADSQGNNRFQGEMTDVKIINRVLTPEEIKTLATLRTDRKQTGDQAVEGLIVALDGGDASTVKKVGDVSFGPSKSTTSPREKVIRFSGKGYLELPHRSRLNCPEALTLSVWVYPTQAVASGSRLIDKSPAGSASGYLLDTWPGGRSLRLITRDPALLIKDVLPLNQWSHVAATVDGKSGEQIIYLNGKKVAQCR